MKRWGVALACALLGLVASYITLFHRSDEDAIREAVAEVVSAVEVKQDDNVLSRNGRLKTKLKPVVDDDVRVEVSELNASVRGRAKLVEEATKLGLVYTSASCALVGTTISMDEGHTTAKLETTAIVTGLRGGERRTDKRDVHFLLRKDGTWRITTIDVAPER